MDHRLVSWDTVHLSLAKEVGGQLQEIMEGEKRGKVGFLLCQRSMKNPHNSSGVKVTTGLPHLAAWATKKWEVRLASVACKEATAGDGGAGRGMVSMVGTVLMAGGPRGQHHL